MNDELREAFEAVYADLVRHGACADDPQICEELWRDFVADMQRGFDSLFPAERSRRQ